MLSVCSLIGIIYLICLILSEDSVSTRETGRRGVPTTLGQLSVSQHLTCSLRSKFVGLQLKGHLHVLLFSSDMLMLQAIALPRVGGVFLHTIHFPFPHIRMWLFKNHLQSVHSYQLGFLFCCVKATNTCIVSLQSAVSCDK